MRLVIFAMSIAFSTTAAQAATFSEDVLPGLDAYDLMDPETGMPNIDTFELSPILFLQRAQKNFDEAIDILDQGLAARADYASILELAPQIRKFMPDNRRLLWLHALALAATGSLEEADATLAQDAAVDISGQSPLPLLAEGMLALRRDRLDEAARKVRAALDRAPNHAYAHNLLGIIEARNGATQDAVAHFSKATSLGPDAAVYWRNLGVAQFSLDQIQFAAQSLQAALNLSPGECPSMIALAQVYEAWRRPDDAEVLARRCLEANISDGRAAGYLIRLQVAQNHFDEAMKTASTFADELSDPSAVMAELHLMMNQPEKALAVLADVGQPSFQSAMALAMSGSPYQALQQAREVRASGDPGAEVALSEAALSFATGEVVDPELRSVLEADPELRASLAWFDALALASSQGADAAADAARGADNMLPGVRFDGVPESDWATLSGDVNRSKAALAMLWLLRGYDMSARAAFQGLQENEAIQQARYFAALADVRLNDLEKAQERLLLVSDAAPRYYSAQILLGEVQLNLGRAAEALASYSKAVEVVEDGGALMKIGLLADYLDKPTVAEDALRRFIALFPDSFIGYNQLAWVFVQRETRLDEALELAQKADGLQPGNANILDNIGWLHFLNGDAERAVRPLREANRRSGASNPDILYHLAVIEAETGSIKKSLELLDRIVEVAPDNHAVMPKVDILRQRLR